MYIRKLLIASVLLWLVSSGLCAEPKVNPKTGLIRVLFMGDSEMQSGKVTPLMVQDPMLHLETVPVEALTWAFGGVDQAARGLRVYFPRVARQVYEGYDVLIIADAREPFFSHKIQNWFKEAVITHGLGFLMAGGPQSFGGYEPWGHPSWEGSPVADVLPVDLLKDWRFTDAKFHLVPAPGQGDHPLLRQIPWRQVPLHDYNRVTAKPGSVVVGVSDEYPPGSPILTYMEMGEGLTEAFVFDWGGGSVREFHRWTYGSIAVSNLIYWVARVAIPEDMSLHVSLRSKITKYISMRDFALSVIEFAEKFNAEVSQASNALSQADEERDQVISRYVKGEYEASLTLLDDALENLEEVSRLAIEAKDRALFWVYVIEWFTVAGTGLICGTVVWTLMVRRAMYRDAGLTRLSTRD